MSAESHVQAGKVYLVGAGPGDPGLLTVRATELIATADIIFYDRLIPPTALDRARADAELVYVGKKPRVEADRDGTTRQEEISRRLIEAARAGRRAVRLKGGDPFVFGRGGEEADALVAAGVPFEIVPGITAGVAAPAYAGIPVTHRDDAGAVAFVSGHEVPDWEAYARFPGTLVFYMGMRSLESNAAALIAAGRRADEPAAVVERGTFPDQRTVGGQLHEIASLAAERDIAAPAVVVVGDVAGRAERLAWFKQGPLTGTSVVVTRARAQAASLSDRFRALGANVHELPLLKIEATIDRPEVREAITAIHSYALIVLTSPNGVEQLFAAMAEQGRDARALAQATVAAIGPSTASALREHGVIADLVPERAVAEGLVEALEALDVFKRPVLVAGAAGMRSVVPDHLASRGAQVDQVNLYETVPEPVSESELEQARGADYVTLASGSAARNLARALGGRGTDSITGKVISIGPITSEVAREIGFDVHAEADPHTLDGLVAAVVADRQDS